MASVFQAKEVMTMLQAAGRKPNNRLVLKMKMLILQKDEYNKQDGTKGYRYLAYSAASRASIQFTSSRLLEESKEAEVLLTLSGFTAYEGK